MNNSYKTPLVDDFWLSGREVHPAVAMAIHAIASHYRTPEAIWEAPTHNEWQHVEMAVESYILCGYFEKEEDGKYQWGQIHIEFPDIQMPEED
jgi:hypothetical protein